MTPRKMHAPSRGRELAVPAVRQRTAYTCGPAALCSALRYLGVAATERDLAKRAGATPENGTSPEALAEAAIAKGVRAVVRDGMTVGQLGRLLKTDAVVIVALQAWSDTKRKPDYKRRWIDGHYVVPIAIHGDTIVFVDPSVPAPGHAKMPLVEFDERWHDEDEERRRHLAIVLRRGRAAPTRSRKAIALD